MLVEPMGPLAQQQSEQLAKSSERSKPEPSLSIRKEQALHMQAQRRIRKERALHMQARRIRSFSSCSR